MLLQLFDYIAREQILGEDQRPLVVRKGKRLKDDHPKREVPPDAPIIDVSWGIYFGQITGETELWTIYAFIE